MVNHGQSAPLTVSFTVEKGEVWIDPDGVAWYVTNADGLGAGIALERTVVVSVEPHTFVKQWRKMGEEA